MWNNIILSASNLYGLIGVYYFFEKGYILPGILHMMWVIFAATYHLMETGKHNLPGVFTPPVSLYVQSWFNYITFLFSFASAITWFFLLLITDVYILKVGLISAICFAIPEVLTNITGEPYPRVYTFFHSLSHILTFCIPNTMGRDDPTARLLH